MMKKSVTVASILLSSLLSFSLSAFAQDLRTTMLPKDILKHHHSVSLNHNRNSLHSNEWFKEQLAQIKDNTAYNVFISGDFTINQTLQTLAALKQNTSAATLYIEDNNKYFSEGLVHHNDKVIAAVIDVLTNNQNITDLVIQNWNDKSKVRHIDLATLEQFTLAIPKTNLESLHFSGWYLTNAMAANIASIIRNTNKLDYFDISFDTDKEEDNDAAVKVAQAIGDSHITGLGFTKTILGSSTQVSTNTKIARALAQAMIDNSAIEFFHFSDFMIDEQAATTFATAFSQANLHILILGNNALNDSAFAAMLPGIQSAPIKSLILWDQNLTMLTDLVNLYVNKSLSQLIFSNVSQNKITTQDMETFSAKLANDTNLYILGISNGLDDNDVSLLVNALNQNNGLEYLLVSGNKYTVSGTRALMTVPEVNTRISQMSIDNLEAVSQEEVDLFYSRLNANQNRARP
jgi:hypothetical protein